ncbi:Cyclic nucleotide-binding-like [Phytophthora cactorum]|nr:Cyclic nucleotide-binding-like [Phytophthora cactorum]
MTTGFFLFAYVIGNFTDIIELTTSETREFNAKMGAVRQMLNHFQLPEALQERLKTFFLFKRFHTITQEHILVHCLPPSLLTDIRLVHLKRMIEKVEFLSGMEGSVTRMLVSQFTQVLVSRGEFICRLEKKGSEKVKNGAPAKLWRLGVRQNSRATSVQRSNSTTEQLKKVNEISAGSYFGENGLFTNGRRNAYIQAQTSCILYKLSRESLELVFDRYPEWKEKVMRIVNIHREQTRLLQLSREEQRRGTDATTGLMLSRADIMNERAERIKDELQHVRLQYGESRNGRFVADTSRVVLDLLERFILTPFHCLVEGTEVQSNFHLSWLRFMVVCIVYVSILTPYQLAMDDLDRFTPMAIVTKAFGLLCELVFILDVWFSWHVRESPASMELYEQDLRATYKKERMLWDTIAAIPFYRFLSDFHCRSWLKLLRCLKIFNVVSYLDELNRRSVTYEITRFWYICLLYLLMIYWAACAYLVVATEVGFGTEWDAWLPSQELVITNPGDPSPSQLALRFLRGLFFATTTFVKKARNLAPDTATLYAFHIAVSFVGLITMSFVLGELASLFISYIGLEVDFRKNHIAIEIYLDRLHVSDRLKARAHAFMTSLWSSHAGVNYEEILGEMPRSIRYPSDESIVVEGSIARAMYFVLRGHVQLHSRSLLALKRPIGLRRGDFFGERGLLGSAISAYTVQSVRACDVLSLSSEALVEVMDQYKFSHLGLRICECAYGHLKKKNLVACSKMDLEEHWGAALLEIVDELRRRYKKCIGVRAATLAARLSSRVRSSNALMSAGSLTDSVTSRLDSVKEINVENDDCARDQILMPSDPLDWNATFRHVNTAAHGENEVAPVALGRRAWLNNRHLDALAKASGGSDQVNIQEDADHVSPVNLQQEQDKKPQEATPSRSAQATSIVSRIRGVNAAAEKLNPSVETQEAVAFSMQDTSRKPRNALVFDGDENTSAPPVHVLRKRSTGDPSGSSSKSAFLGDADVESLE